MKLRLMYTLNKKKNPQKTDIDLPYSPFAAIAATEVKSMNYQYEHYVYF